jgi:predicted nucleic acid-binding protein
MGARVAKRVLVDTDVLIDYLRGRPEAIEYLEAEGPEPLISAISVAELYAGVRDEKERKALELFVAGFEVVPVDGIIAERGGLYRRDYVRSHGVTLADALIAGTASVRRARLVTLNTKHFPMLADATAPYAAS